MKTIDIIAPNYAVFKSIYGEEVVNDKFSSESTDGFMQLLSNSITLLGGNALRYNCVELTAEGLTAEINVSRLPDYKRTACVLDRYGFEEEMIRQTIKGNKRYGSDCPIATPESLRQPLLLWCEKWLTIYLWTLMREAYTLSGTQNPLEAPTELISHEELMKTIETQLAQKPQVEKVDYQDIATSVIDGRQVRRIVEKAMAAAGDSDKNEAIADTATTEILVIIGELLECIKTDDEFFKDDDYYM